MAKTKAEMMAEQIAKQQLAQKAFAAGNKAMPEISSQDIPQPLHGEPELSLDNELLAYAEPNRTQGRKGEKVPRMNLGIPEDVYEYIKRGSRRQGMTYSEYISAVMRQRKKNGIY